MPVKIVKFNKQNFAPTEKEVESEQGEPNFYILVDDMGAIYVITMKNKVLEVYRAL